MKNEDTTKCEHMLFESLVVTNEKGRTVEYQCTSCKKWFSHKEKTKICSNRSIDLERLHSESSVVRPGISRTMSSFERGLIDKITKLEVRVSILEEFLKENHNE